MVENIRKPEPIMPSSSSVVSLRTTHMKTWLSKMYGIVISVEEPALWRIDPKTGKKVYEPCDSCCAIMRCKQRRVCAPHCQRQFMNAHEEADQVADVYMHFGSMTV